MPRFARDESCFYPFTLQKMEDEVAYLIVSDRCQECWSQAQTPRANADVRRTTTNIGRKARNFHEWSAYVVGVEVN
jgi:hypothetical protein